MLHLTILVAMVAILWSGCWQVGADDIEGVAYGSRVLLKADGTWEYSETSIKAKTKEGKVVELKGDNTWEYVQVQLRGAITFRIAAFDDWQRAKIKRDDEGEVIGVEVWTGCAMTLEVSNTLDVPIRINKRGWFYIVAEAADIDWTFYIELIVPPGEKRLFDGEVVGVTAEGAKIGYMEGGQLYPDRTELTADEKKVLIDSFGCKAVEGMTLLLLTEGLATGIEIVPPAATDVDIVSVVQTSPNEVVNFETKWRR